MINPEIQSPLDRSLIYIRSIKNCPASYFSDPGRKDFFEIVWLKKEKPLHKVSDPKLNIKGDWIYFIPPYRLQHLNKAGKNGEIISFRRELLEDADGEVFSDLFKIFNDLGDFVFLYLKPEDAAELSAVFDLLEKEYLNADNSLPIVKALLKVFLLKLIQFKEDHFITIQDIDQKRIYELFSLLEKNYIQQRNTAFYANELGISSKRLNEILKEKLDKTVIQLIHDRLIVELKRNMIHTEKSLKEIAFDLGFSDQAYFSRFFKKQTGQTPENFQKQARVYTQI